MLSDIYFYKKTTENIPHISISTEKSNGKFTFEKWTVNNMHCETKRE